MSYSGKTHCASRIARSTSHHMRGDHLRKQMRLECENQLLGYTEHSAASFRSNTDFSWATSDAMPSLCFKRDSKHFHGFLTSILTILVRKLRLADLLGCTAWVRLGIGMSADPAHKMTVLTSPLWNDQCWDIGTELLAVFDFQRDQQFQLTNSEGNPPGNEGRHETATSLDHEECENWMNCWENQNKHKKHGSVENKIAESLALISVCYQWSSQQSSLTVSGFSHRPRTQKFAACRAMLRKTERIRADAGKMECNLFLPIFAY